MENDLSSKRAAEVDLTPTKRSTEIDVRVVGVRGRVRTTKTNRDRQLEVDQRGLLQEPLLGHNLRVVLDSLLELALDLRLLARTYLGIGGSGHKADRQCRDYNKCEEVRDLASQGQVSSSSLSN